MRDHGRVRACGRSARRNAGSERGRSAKAAERSPVQRPMPTKMPDTLTGGEEAVGQQDQREHCPARAAALISYEDRAMGPASEDGGRLRRDDVSAARMAAAAAGMSFSAARTGEDLARPAAKVMSAASAARNGRWRSRVVGAGQQEAPGSRSAGSWRLGAADTGRARRGRASCTTATATSTPAMRARAAATTGGRDGARAAGRCWPTSCVERVDEFEEEGRRGQPAQRQRAAWRGRALTRELLQRSSRLIGPAAAGARRLTGGPSPSCLLRRALRWIGYSGVSPLFWRRRGTTRTVVLRNGRVRGRLGPSQMSVAVSTGPFLRTAAGLDAWRGRCSVLVGVAPGAKSAMGLVELWPQPLR